MNDQLFQGFFLHLEISFPAIFFWAPLYSLLQNIHYPRCWWERVVVNFSFFPLNCLRTTDPCQTRRLEWRWRGNGRRIHSSLAHETVLVLWYYLLPSSFNGEGGRECKRSKEGVTCVQKRRLEREIKTEKIRQKQQSFWPTMIKYVFMVLILLKHRHVRT